MNIRNTIGVLAASALLAACGVRAALISATFTDASTSTDWTDDNKAVVNQAIADWTSMISRADAGGITINFELTSSANVSGIAEWVGIVKDASVSSHPWNSGNLTHTIYINPSEISFSLGDPVANYYDGLSVFRHEIGHALGFADQFFYSTNPDVDLWATSITSGTFTANSLNVAMTSTSDLSHVAVVNGVNDAMVTSLSTGIRYDITSNDARMLSAAYGYTLVPEPASILVLLGGGTFVLLRRPARRRR